MNPVEADMRVVFASHTAPTGVFRVGSHHLSREFCRLGHEVFHIASPVTAAHLLRIDDKDVRTRLRWSVRGVHEDEDGVRHIVPFTPLPGAWIPGSYRQVQLRLAFARYAQLRQHLFECDIMFIDQPALVDLVSIFRPNRVVYRPTDVHFRADQRVAELKALSLSHAVVATSKYVLDYVTQESLPIPQLVLENGVEFDRFVGGKLHGQDRRGFAYVGALDDRFGWEELRAMATALPSETFRIAGPLSAPAPLKPMPLNVEYIGPLAYDDVPAFLAGAKVGLLPLSGSPANAGRSPMKYYEYLAAGLTVVATASQALVGRNGPGVFLYGRGDPEGAARAAGDALEHASVLNQEGQAFASRFSWTARARELAGFVEGL